MRRIKRLGPVAAVASMLMAMAGAGSASAANWDPANTTWTAHGSLTFEGVTTGAAATCTLHASVRSSGGSAAVTIDQFGHPFGPTFSGCTTNIASTLVSVAATPSTPGIWTFTAASTTNVGVANENFTITVRSTTGAVICTVSAMNVTYGGSTWSNATSTFTHNSGTFPVVESGLGCPSDTAMRITGSIVIPGATIT